MLDEREKQNQKSHWRAIAEQLGLPTEPEEETVSEPSPAQLSSEPEERETVRSEPIFPEVEAQKPSAAASWQPKFSEPRFSRSRPELYPEPSDSEERQEAAPAKEEEEPDIIVTEGFIESEEEEAEEAEPEEQPRRRRRRGRRGKRSGQKDKREMVSEGSIPSSLEEANEQDHAQEIPIVAAPGGEPEESAISKEEPGGEKTRRRRRSRSRRRDKKQKPQGREAITELGGEVEGVSPDEEELQEMTAEELVETLDNEEFIEAEDQEEERKASKPARRRKEVKEQETEETDYDIMDEGPDDFSDWNVPSWQELIASLYRPER